MTLDDTAGDGLLDAFERGELESADFPHASHVRVAWELARRYGADEGLSRLIDGIRAIARRAGRPEAYHVTITRAWFELVASVDRLEEHEELLDRTLLDRYYTRERLASGREQWVEPDLHPLRLPPPPPAPPGPVDLRPAFRRIPTTIAVLATGIGHEVHATTVGSLACVSRESALVSVCLGNESRTLDLLRHADGFTVSILASGQEWVAARFADGRRPAGSAQFAGVPHRMGRFGPAIEGSAARLDCELHAQHRCGDHHIVVAAVRSAETAADVHPLVQHDARFH
jgi:flavin reductase (DIM6/NTAB) family NADH-FMN oxidoreductase RutF